MSGAELMQVQSTRHLILWTQLYTISLFNSI